jgi:hypothetical protein
VLNKTGYKWAEISNNFGIQNQNKGAMKKPI